jgi:hypothetical protein
MGGSEGSRVIMTAHTSKLVALRAAGRDRE